MNKRKILVGSWIIDLETGEMLHAEQSRLAKRLTNKPLSFLTLLFEHDGQPVPKDEIIKKVWRGITSPENVTQSVNKLRLMLDDYNKQYIITVPGKGYALSFSKLESCKPETKHPPTIPQEIVIKNQTPESIKNKTNNKKIISSCKMALILITIMFFFTSVHHYSIRFKIEKKIMEKNINKSNAILNNACYLYNSERILACG